MINALVAGNSEMAVLESHHEGGPYPGAASYRPFTLLVKNTHFLKKFNRGRPPTQRGPSDNKSYNRQCLEHKA